MLLKDFYTASNIITTENAVTADIIFNAAHDIFKGHFPQQPVVPGVCMMQIVKETLEQSLAKNTRLIKASNIKFLSVIVPAESQIVKLQLSYKTINEEIDVTAELQNMQNPSFKFRGSFIVNA